MNIAAKPASIAAEEAAAILERLGVETSAYTGGDLKSFFSPITGEQTGSLKTVSASEATRRYRPR